GREAGERAVRVLAGGAALERAGQPDAAPPDEEGEVLAACKHDVGPADATESAGPAGGVVGKGDGVGVVGLAEEDDIALEDVSAGYAHGVEDLRPAAGVDEYISGIGCNAVSDDAGGRALPLRQLLDEGAAREVDAGRRGGIALDLVDA